MIRSFLIGLVAGQRGITPLASIALATRGGRLPARLPLQRLLENPVIASGTALLAAAEMVGDKMKSAPDRIVPVGLVVRSMTAAYSGAALAPRGRRTFGAAVAVGAALTSSYIGWRARCAAMRRYGQTVTGLVEDAIVLGSGIAVANRHLRPPDNSRGQELRRRLMEQKGSGPVSHAEFRRDQARIPGM